MKRVLGIGVLIGCVETCFRDRGIDWLCMKRVSGIGVLIGCVETRFRDRGIDRSLLCDSFFCSPLLVCCV